MKKALKKAMWSINDKCLALAVFMLTSPSAVFAKSIIPLPKDEQISGDKGIIDVVMALLQGKVLKTIIITGAILLLFTALSGMWKGYKEYQERRDITILKESIFATVLMVAVGGIVLFLLEQVRTYTF